MQNVRTENRRLKSSCHQGTLDSVRGGPLQMLCGATDGLLRLVKGVMQHSTSSALTYLKHVIPFAVIYICRSVNPFSMRMSSA